MRSSAIYAAVLALIVVLAGYFTIALEVTESPWPLSASGSLPVGGGAGNMLQPVAEDLTWIYRTEGIWPHGVMRVTVLGREPSNGEDLWLIEEWVGLPDAIRYLVVNRGGDLWVLAIERIGDDGDWQRTEVAPPQLWQPGAREQTWTYAVFGPDRAFEKAMRKGGTKKVLGSRRQLWLVEDQFPSSVSRSPITTMAEGIGPIEFDGPSYDGSGPLRLAEFRTTPPPFEGTFEARTSHGIGPHGHPLWTLVVGPDGSGSIGSDLDGTSALRWAVRDGDTIELAGEPGGWPFRWLGRMEVVGLLGQATFRDESFVLEFVPR